MLIVCSLIFLAVRGFLGAEYSVIQPSTLDQVESLGCWRDAANRAITSIEGLHPLLRDDFRKRLDPVKRCAVVAQERGYNIFALQNGGHCMGDANFNYDRYGPSNLCRDGRGGIWANSVYSYRTSFQRSNADAPGRGLKIRHCQKPIDIALLLDGSGTNDNYNVFRWTNMLAFTRKVLEGFDDVNMHSSVITYGGDPKVVIDMNDENQQRSYVNDLFNSSFPGGERSLNDALKLAWKEQFKLSPRIANKVILALVTGDLPSGLSGSSLFLSKKGVRVIAIGVDEDAHYRFLQTVASGRFPRNIFSLSSTQLEEAAPYVVQEVCRVAKWKGRKLKRKQGLSSIGNGTEMEQGNITASSEGTKKYLAPAIVIDETKPAKDRTFTSAEIKELNNHDKNFVETKIYKMNPRRKLGAGLTSQPMGKHRNLPYFNMHHKNSSYPESSERQELSTRKTSSTNVLGSVKEESEVQQIEKLVANALASHSNILTNNDQENQKETNLDVFPELSSNTQDFPGNQPGQNKTVKLNSRTSTVEKGNRFHHRKGNDPKSFSSDFPENQGVNNNYSKSKEYERKIQSGDENAEPDEKVQTTDPPPTEGSEVINLHSRNTVRMPSSQVNQVRMPSSTADTGDEISSLGMDEGNEAAPSKDNDIELIAKETGKGSYAAPNGPLMKNHPAGTGYPGNGNYVVTDHTFVRFDQEQINENSTLSNFNSTKFIKNSGNVTKMVARPTNSYSLLTTSNTSLPPNASKGRNNTSDLKRVTFFNTSQLGSDNIAKEVNESINDNEKDKPVRRLNGTVDEDRKGNETIDIESDQTSNRTTETNKTDFAGETFNRSAVSAQNISNTTSVSHDITRQESVAQNGNMTGSVVRNLTFNFNKTKQNLVKEKHEKGNITEILVKNISDSGNLTKSSFKSRSQYHAAFGHAWNFSDVPDEEELQQRKGINPAPIEGSSLKKLNHSLVLMADGETATTRNATVASNQANSSLLSANNETRSDNNNTIAQKISRDNETVARNTESQTNSTSNNTFKGKRFSKGIVSSRSSRHFLHGQQHGNKSLPKSASHNNTEPIDAKKEMFNPESDEAVLSEDAAIRNPDPSRKTRSSRTHKGYKETQDDTENIRIVSHLVDPVSKDHKIRVSPTANQASPRFPTTEEPFPTSVDSLLTTMSQPTKTHPSSQPSSSQRQQKKNISSPIDAPQIQIKFNNSALAKENAQKNKAATGTTSVDLSKILPKNIDTGKYFISHIGGNEFVLTLRSDRNVIEEHDSSSDPKGSIGSAAKELEDIQDAITRTNVAKETERGSRRNFLESKKVQSKRKKGGTRSDAYKEIVIRETTDDDSHFYKFFLNVMPRYRIRTTKLIPENYTGTEIYKRTRTERVDDIVDEDNSDAQVLYKGGNENTRQGRSRVTQANVAKKRMLLTEDENYDYSFDETNTDNSTQDDLMPSIIEDSYDEQDGSGGTANVTESVTNQTKITKNETGVINQTKAFNHTNTVNVTSQADNKTAQSLNNNTTKQPESKTLVTNQSAAIAAVKNESCNRTVKVLYAIDVSDGLGLGPTREKRWKRLRDFIQDINVEVLDDSTLGYIVYDVEPRFLAQLSPCDEKTEYFVTSNPCLCENRAVSARDNVNSCSTITPTKEESIEDFGVLGPRTGKAIEKARSLLKQRIDPDEKKLIVLITHKMSADDVASAEKTLKDDGISLIDIEIGNRKEYYGRQKSTIYKRNLNLHRSGEPSFAEDHKLQVSFQGLQKALSNIFYKICSSQGEEKGILTKRFIIPMQAHG